MSVEIISLSELGQPLLDDLIALHVLSIPNSRFSTLPKSLQRKIYLEFVGDEFSRVYVVQEAESHRTVGAVLVQDYQGKNPGTSFATYFRYLPSIAACVIHHPIIWVGQTFAELRLNSRKIGTVYISAIFVSKTHQGRGLGLSLFRRVKEDFPRANLSVMTESTNRGALMFYVRNNWKISASILNTIFLTQDI